MLAREKHTRASHNPLRTISNLHLPPCTPRLPLSTSITQNRIQNQNRNRAPLHQTQPRPLANHPSLPEPQSLGTGFILALASSSSTRVSNLIPSLEKITPLAQSFAPSSPYHSTTLPLSSGFSPELPDTTSATPHLASHTKGLSPSQNRPRTPRTHLTASLKTPVHSTRPQKASRKT